MEGQEVSVLKNSVYAYLLEGAIVIVLNVPLTIAMTVVQKIRSRREFQVIIGLSMTDVAFGAAFVLTGLYRFPAVFSYEQHGIPMIHRFECTKTVCVQLLTACYQMQGVLSLVVAFDRLLAVAAPIKYLKLGNYYNVIIIARPCRIHNQLKMSLHIWRAQFSWLLIAQSYALISKNSPCVAVLIPTMVNLVLTLHDETLVSALCITKEAVFPDFHSYVLLLRMICISLSGLIYVYIVWRLKQHLAKHEQTTRHKMETAQLRSVRHSTVTVGLTTINALVFLLIPDIFAYFEIAGIHNKYATFLYSLYCVNVNLNFLILITRHKDIRYYIRYFVRAVILRRRPLPLNPNLPSHSHYRAINNVVTLGRCQRSTKSTPPYFIPTASF